MAETCKIVPEGRDDYIEYGRDGKPTGRSLRFDSTGVTAQTREGGECRSSRADGDRARREVDQMPKCEFNGREVSCGSLGQMQSTPARQCFKDDRNTNKQCTIQ